MQYVQIWNMFCHGMNKLKIFFAPINKSATSKLANWRVQRSADASSSVHRRLFTLFPPKVSGRGNSLYVQERRKLMQKSCIPHFFQVAWNSQKCHSFLNQLMQPNWAHALQSFSRLSIKWANSSLLSWTHFSQAVKMSRYCDLTSWVLFVMLCISRSTFRSLIRPVHFVTRPTWVGTAPLKCVWLDIVGPVRSSLRYDAPL